MSRALLPVRIGDVWLAIDALHAREILGRRPLVPLPGAPAGLPGVIAWQGRAIAVVDLGALTGACAPIREPRERTLVIQHGSVTFAVPVDGVREVQVASAAQLRPAHATRQRFAASEVELDKTPVPVLELSAVVDAIRGGAKEGYT
jgi:chemotaxis signal transduction protein